MSDRPSIVPLTDARFYEGHLTDRAPEQFLRPYFDEH
jgi:hypothetical protein